MLSKIMLTIAKSRLIPWIKRRIYARRGEPYRVQGQTLRYIPGSRPVRLRYKNSSNAIVRYDALQVELLSTSLMPGDTAIDIGAYGGQYCILIAAMVGDNGNVIAFEPDPYALELLRKNLELNPRLKRPRIENIALSDADGDAILYSRGGDSRSSLVRCAVDFRQDHHVEKIRVRTARLDSYLAQNKIPTPTWVKIDAEGAEIRILQGATTLLRGSAQIICELHPYAWNEFGNEFAELKDLVSSSGRRMRYLGSECEMTQPEYGSVLIERV
jgi:FkbM family methyltransferase